jgi:hypothetical protein
MNKVIGTISGIEAKWVGETPPVPCVRYGDFSLQVTTSFHLGNAVKSRDLFLGADQMSLVPHLLQAMIASRGDDDDPSSSVEVEVEDLSSNSDEEDLAALQNVQLTASRQLPSALKLPGRARRKRWVVQEMSIEVRRRGSVEGKPALEFSSPGKLGGSTDYLFMQVWVGLPAKVDTLQAEEQMYVLDPDVAGVLLSRMREHQPCLLSVKETPEGDQVIVSVR